MTNYAEFKGYFLCQNSVQGLMVTNYVSKLMCPNECNQNQSFGIITSKFSWMFHVAKLLYHRYHWQGTKYMLYWGYSQE